MTALVNYFATLPWLELIAMLLALAYAILVARGSIWCWPAAFISTALYTYIFYDVLLLMDSALNVYYLLMAVYGYWLWHTNQQANKQLSENSTTISPSTIAVIAYPALWHIKVCLVLAVLASALGYFMANFTPADFPYLDTFTTVYAVFATYLVAKKVLENWLYWLVIDFVSIFLYFEKALYPTTILFIIYLAIAAYGYVKWLGFYRNSQTKIPAGAIG